MQINGCLRAGAGVQGRRRKWGVTANKFKVLGVIEILIILTILKTIVHYFKWVNCVVCKIYLNPKLLFKKRKMCEPLPPVTELPGCL